MKTLAKILIILTVFFGCVVDVQATAGINRKINFQGKVVNKGIGSTDGTNVADGNHNFVFSMWTTLSAGTSIWSEVWNAGTTQVAVNSGIFQVALGSQVTFPPTVDFNSDSLFVSVNYEGDGDMTPRIQMAAVPYAFNAEKVGGLTVTNTTGTLTIPNGTTIAFGGSFATTGIGISLNQNLSTGSTVTFAGLNVGGTVTLTNVPINVGTTVLFIDANGRLSQGYMTSGTGTTYTFIDGLTDPGTHFVGLGGTLTQNTQIGTSNFALSFLGLGNSLGLSVGASGFVGIGTSNPAYKLDVYGAGSFYDLLAQELVLAGSNTGLLANYKGYNGYTNFSGGIGTGGAGKDSIINSQRITSSGNLVNIGSILAGEMLLTRAGTFASRTDYITGTTPSNVVTGDVNGDGFLDLIVSNSGVTTVSVLLGNGDGTFGTKSDYITGSVGSGVQIGDLNGDGMLDIVVANSGTTSFSVLMNNGVGTSFGPKVDYTIASGSQNLTIGDLNGDGKPDVAVSNSTQTYASVLLNKGNGTFATRVDYPVGFNNYSIAMGDLNGDGKPDLITADNSTTAVSVILNNGGGTFGATTNFNVGAIGRAPADVKIGDLNGDGKLDMYSVNAGSSTVSVFINNSANNSLSFATKVEYSTSVYTSGAAPTLSAIGDVNGDGKPDLVVSNNGTTSVGVLLNVGDGTFSNLVEYTTGASPKGVALGDFNGDGKMDIAVVEVTSTRVGVLLNLATPMFYAKAGTGNVGIGTTNPVYSLQIGGSGSLGVGGSVVFKNIAVGTGSTILYIDSSGNLVQGTLPAGGSSTGVNGLNSNGSNIGLGGSLTQTTNIGTSSFGLSFLGQGNSQAMFIGTSGFVGIGTTNPQAKLEINSGTSGTAGLRFSQISSATTVGTTNNKVLTVDGSGNVFLAADQTGSGSMPSGSIDSQTVRYNLGSGLWETNSNFLVAGNGTIQVKGTTTDIVKTSTGTGTTGDFESVGSTQTNVLSNNNLLSILSGTIPNNLLGSISTNSIATTVPVGPGGHVIIRDDGYYVIVGGTSAATASVWGGTGTTMTQITVATGAVLPGAGAISLKRPDGRYLLVHGNTSGLSSVFDPYNQTAAVVGPQLLLGVGATVAVGAGTNAFQRNDGKYVVIGGGTTAWGLYDPGLGNTGVFTGGTTVAFGFGAGAHALLRDDGNFVVYQGVGGSAVYFYNNSGVPVPGNMNLNPGFGGTNPTITTAGAFSMRMQNGDFLTIDGGIQSSWIYDATVGQYGTFTQQTGVGMGPNEQLTDGAMSMWRQDGKYLLMVGSGSSKTYIIDPSVDVGQTMFSVGPTLPYNGGLGMTPFMGPEGKYYIVMGAGKSMVTYDIGYVIGGQSSGIGTSAAFYESEPLNTSSHLNMSTTLNWNANTEGLIQFYARTGVGLAGVLAASYEPIYKSGDNIGTGSTLEDYAQIKIVFKRNLPRFIDQDWGLRRSNQTRYRRNDTDPIVYDYTIDNSQSVHKTQFDFGNAANGSGPIQTNLINNSDRNLGLSLALFQNAGGVANVSSSINLGVFSRHNGLSVGVSQATVVMRRPNNQFEVMVGSTSAFSLDYDQFAQTFSMSVGVTPTAKIGAGALAIKRPDGKFLVVLGDGTSVTNIYDPLLDNYSAGPSLTGLAGRGAMAIPLPNGRVMIVHGNYTSTSSIYDPFMNTMVPGVNMSSWVGNGALNIPRPDGTFLVVLGSTENCSTLPTTTNIFNPYNMTIGTSSPAISIVAGRSVGPGSLAIPRLDGSWLVVLGAGTSTGTATSAVCTATNTTSIYNPVLNSMATGPALSANAGYGANAVPRADGTWQIQHGANLTTSSIFVEKGGLPAANIGLGGTIFPGPASIAVVGGVGTSQGSSLGGAVSFQRDDGKFVMILGAGGTLVNTLDALWVDKGIYKSEEMYVSDLDNNSTLTWQAVPTYGGISAEVKTAATQNDLQTASSTQIPSPGGLINGGSNKWVQVSFNFKRQFPSYGGVVSDTWYNGGSQNLLSNRIITVPTLAQYGITKDVNLIDLKADGMSVFRVSTNGNVYTSGNGVVNSGGADLAENYTSSSELLKGEVVSIDPTNNHAVQRSKYQYQPDLIGVVSSDPGFVAGAYTKDSYPIALVGRVPVKVTTENGNIRVGDRITSSSTAGYAMKAVKAGRVIGTALESIDPKSLVECPVSNFGNVGQKCTTIMTFVNLSDYLGLPVEEAMAETSKSVGAPVPSWANGEDEKILQFLADSKNNSDSQKLSDVFADRVVSTKIVADTIVANKIQAKSIEGLEMFTDKIGSLSQKYDDLKTEMNSKNASDSAILSVTPTRTAGELLITSNYVVKALSEFWDKVLFRGDVVFEKQPTFSNQTAGFAVINSGDDRAEITFDSEYRDAPVVNVTMVVENEDEKEILEQGYVYFVTKKDGKGFSIVLNKKATTDIKFSWSALSIKDAKTFKKEVVTITPAPNTLIPTLKLLDASMSSMATYSSEASGGATIGL